MIWKALIASGSKSVKDPVANLNNLTVSAKLSLPNVPAFEAENSVSLFKIPNKSADAVPI